MVMDVLGPSLEALFNFCERTFIETTEALIAIQSRSFGLHAFEELYPQRHQAREYSNRILQEGRHPLHD